MIWVFQPEMQKNLPVFPHYIPAQMSRMNYFLVHLSLADILTVLLSLLPEIAWSLTSPHFWGGRGVCKAVKFLQVVYRQIKTIKIF